MQQQRKWQPQETCSTSLHACKVFGVKGRKQGQSNQPDFKAHSNRFNPLQHTCWLCCLIAKQLLEVLDGALPVKVLMLLQDSGAF